jgi:3-carboxy-cis,cis-muconate cycloisomerase
MAVLLLDSVLHGRLFGDAATAAAFSDKAELAAMVVVERALARVQGRLGVIPAEAAAAIDAGLEGVVLDPADLVAGVASSGVVAPGLVAALRARLPEAAAGFLHWGATSQDIADTALSLRLAPVLADLDARLAVLADTLEAAARRWAGLPMAARTRTQVAAPTSFGLRVARWRQPIPALRAELSALRPRVLRVQFGGAVGTNAVVAPHGEAVAAMLAEELELAAGPCWHGERSGPVALAGWCAAVAGACAKMAADLILMGRSEAGEAAAGSGGGSSTLPQKANPVAAETVVALARHAAAMAGAMHHAAIHQEERDGAAWGVEMLALPQAVVAAAAALRHAQGLAATLRPDAERMWAQLTAQGGVAMAERASFLLMADRPRADAQAIIARAVAATAAGETLAAALARLAPGRDWAAALDPREPAAEAAVEAALRG